MENSLKIYIDRLGDGQTEKIEVTIPPGMIGVDEKDLQFKNFSLHYHRSFVTFL